MKAYTKNCTAKSAILKWSSWKSQFRSTSLSRSGSPTRERALNESLRMAELQVEFYFVKKRQPWNWRMDATILQERILKKWRGSEIILNVACHVQNREYGSLKRNQLVLVHIIWETQWKIWKVLEILITIRLCKT